MIDRRQTPSEKRQPNRNRARIAGLAALTLAPAFVGSLPSVRAYDVAPMCAYEAPLTSLEPVLHAAPIEPICHAPRETPSPGPVSPTRAKEAVERSVELESLGELGLADLELQLLEEAYPRLADHVALRRARLALDAGQPTLARAHFERAAESVSPSVVVRAEAGAVRARLAAGDRRAPEALAALLRTYPEHPEGAALRLELGRYYEAAGKTREAIQTLRDLDLEHPGSLAAADARARLDAMAQAGVAVRALGLGEKLARVERLCERGPLPMAREAVDALLADPAIGGELRSKALVLRANLRAFEARFAEARDDLEAASTDSSEEEATALQERAEALAALADARVPSEAEIRVRQTRRSRSYDGIPTTQLVHLLRLAAAAGLTDDANGATAALAARTLPPKVALEVAILASGSVDDVLIEQLLAPIVSKPNESGLVAAYHLARSVERRGQLSRAEALFVEVRERDREFPRFYALLADLRLRTIHATIVASCEQADDCVVPPEEVPEPMRAEGRQSVQWEAIDRPATEEDLAMLATRLAPLLPEHGGAFPWIARAHDALALGWRDVAADELFEAYLAWRDALGRKITRAGLESVARGADRDRHSADWKTKHDRSALDVDARRVLAEVAQTLGEEGIAVGFDIGRLSDRPTPYPAAVAEAARRHAIDPALLFAVMRVESVLQPRIVSYAGAVGLLQIMPRTGRLIARQRGIDDFHPADLLDPTLNLDFAAWYLASLLDRFDGHLPLAIAAYNGGPHNVRRWMAEHGSAMPLDAFLERIPFTQTHRYVRRVLANYAAYRELEGRPMEPLSMHLPSIDGPDPVGF